MTTNSGPKEVKSLGSRGIWFGVAAPILGLVLLIAAGALSLTWEFAQRQDRLWIKQTQQLVNSALAGRKRALSTTIVDYGLWDDAYRNITLRWNQVWIAANFYSSAVDGIVVYHRDGVIRYTWFPQTKAIPYGMIAAAATRAAASPGELDSVGGGSDAGVQAPSGPFVLNDQLMLASASPVNWDTKAVRQAHGDRAPEDYVAAVDLISSDELATIGADLNLSGLAFRSGLLTDRESADLVWMPVYDRAGRVLGGMTWQNMRPGTQQFAKVVWPIAIGLLLAGLLTTWVTRYLVNRQLTVMTRADSVLEAGRLKAQFIATMSHELRTPLNAIIGYSELIHESAESDSKQDRQTRADAERIKGSANIILRLINEIIDHAKIEAGFLPMSLEAVDVAHALSDLSEAMQPLAEAAGNRLSVHVYEAQLSVMADPARLSQCLLNLAGNAVKFTKNGTIDIKARRENKGKTEFVVISVADTGAGIDAATMRRLFSPFHQAAHWETRTHGGAGLGLSITRRLARAMHGDVTASSEFKKGSTFELWLPAAMPLKAAA